MLALSDPRIETALDEVLAGDQLTEFFNYTGPSDRTVPRDEVLAQVQEKVGKLKDLPDRLDAAVEARGGEKIEMIRVSQKIRNLGLRLIGHSPDPDEELYVIPTK